MTVPTEIVDAGDPRLDDYRGLRDPARRSRGKTEGGFFVAEGIIVIDRLLESRLNVRSLLLSPSKYERLRPRLDDRPGVAVFVADRNIMEHIVGFDLHRGALAAADRPPSVPLDRALTGRRLVAALEGINDHENLGAIIRSAAAFGVEAVVLDPTCADPWYRRSVRVSMGTIFELPIVRADPWPGSIGLVRDLGFRVLALTVGKNAIPIDAVATQAPTMVMLGAEGTGLTSDAIEIATEEVTIPIVPSVDSLNVGHAAAIAFHRLAEITHRSSS